MSEVLSFESSADDFRYLHNQSKQRLTFLSAEMLTCKAHLFSLLGRRRVIQTLELKSQAVYDIMIETQGPRFMHSPNLNGPKCDIWFQVLQYSKLTVVFAFLDDSVLDCDWIEARF